MSEHRKVKACNCVKVNRPKLKSLCLHGYRQNAEVFKQKTGSFRKCLHKWVDFTYVTAPHKVIPLDDLSKADELDSVQTIEVEEYGWFFNRDDKTYRGIRKGGPAIGFEESLKLVEATFKEHGPFDGIMGFSQGGCFVGLLCSLQQRNLLNFKFNFAVIISGFKSNCLPHMKYYSDIITLPSLFVYGKKDNIIPFEMSAGLLECFEYALPVIHPGGHYVPASSAEKVYYQDFFLDQHQQKYDEKMIAV